MSVRLGPGGPIKSPVAQRQSSALMRRRPVDRAHPGPPTAPTTARPSTTKEVCHETDRRTRLELSRSRASDAGASRLRRESSAATESFAARRNSSRNSAATIPAHAAPRGRFQALLHAQRMPLTASTAITTSAESSVLAPSGELPEWQGAGLLSQGRRRCRRGRSIRSLSATGPCGRSSGAEQPPF
jgi:hypothetical protein